MKIDPKMFVMFLYFLFLVGRGEGVTHSAASAKVPGFNSPIARA